MQNLNVPQMDLPPHEAGGIGPKPADRRARVRRLPRLQSPAMAGSGQLSAYWMALIATGLWFTVSLIAFWNSMTSGGAANMTAGGTFGFVAIAFSPPIFFFVSAHLYESAKHMQRMTLALGRTAKRLTEPVSTAANDVVDLGTAVRQEIDSLNNSIEGALKRVSMLEAIVREKASAIDNSALHLEQRVEVLDARLMAERDRIEGMARLLSDESEEIAKLLSDQAQAVTDATDRVDGQLSSSREALIREAQQLAETVDSVVERVSRVGETIAQQGAKLEDISEKALDRTDTIVGRYEQQRLALGAVHDELAADQRRVDTALESQRRVLSELSELVSAQAGRIEDAVRRCLEDLDGSLGDTAQRAEDVAATFADRLRDLKTQSGECTDALLAAAERAQSLTDTTGGALRKQAREVERTLILEAERARETLEALTAESTDTLRAEIERAEIAMRQLQSMGTDAIGDQASRIKAELQDQLGMVRHAIEDNLADLTGRVETLGREMRNQVHAGTEGLDAHIEASDTALQAASARLKDTLASIRGEADQIRFLIQRAADELDTRMGEFPERAGQSAGEVRAVMDEQFAAMSRMADEAVERARILGRALQPFVDPMPRAGQTSARTPRSDTSASRSADRGDPDLDPEPAASPAPTPKATAPHRRRAAPATPKPEAVEPPPRETARTDRPAPPKGVTEDDLALPKPGAGGRQTTLGAGAPQRGRDPYPEVWTGLEKGEAKPRKRRDPILPALGSFTGKPTRPKKASPDNALDDDLEIGAATDPDSAGPGPRTRGDASRGRLSWSAILAAAEKASDEPHRPANGSDTLLSEARRGPGSIVETLQALAIDLDRALESKPPVELLERYAKGERDVFAQRVASLRDREGPRRLERKYRDDGEFRSLADSYIEEFEELLAHAGEAEQGPTLARSYLDQPVGAVYQFLIAATR